MNFERILDLLNQAIQALEQSAKLQVALKDEIAAKDWMILNLEQQLTTANTVMFADRSQMEEMQASLDRLEELVTPKK